ncbi:CDP-glucose 4,6-dehydratase [Luteitalea sp.]|jgi:CDP-glucose 4,6-dehydratase|uniref:CDP-glucose 4,6-dehydratase n=1 Tax=Luteitalea sp. TaxID=2004800 RepID=UPI0037C9A3A9
MTFPGTGRVLPGAWRGRRVLVTGHTGFKGAWLSTWLASLGAEVHGLALAPATTPSLFELIELDTQVRHTLGDIRDAGTVQAAVAAAAPQVVFHLAAQPLVRASYREPLETFATNVQGTAHVLEACRHVSGIEAVVCITTDKCYENREWARGYREDDHLGGHDPYSASKAAAELVAASYRRSFGPESIAMARLATARAGNVIGGGDWSEDRLVPDAVRAFTNGRVLDVRRPAATRPWQHVIAPLSGYLVLAQALLDGQPVAEGWNFGPADADVVAVGDFLDALTRAWGPRAAWRATGVDTGPHEAGLLKLDVTKAGERLAWQPRWDLATALRMTVEWYRAWHAGARAGELRQIMLAQIEAYTQADA